MKRTLIEIPNPSDDGPALDCGHPADRARVEAAAARTVDCELCDRRMIPSITSLGRRTPTFTPDSVPPALLSDHRTNAWAELIVVAGTVEFEQRDPPWRTTAGVGHPVVIVPGVTHRVVPGAGAEFHVQFHDLPPGFRSPGSRPDEAEQTGTDRSETDRPEADRQQRNGA